MHQDAKIPQEKPVLNAESFQRLLAAAFILQSHNDRRRSFQPIGASHPDPFPAGAVVQERPASVMIRERHLQADQPDTVPGYEIATKHPLPGRLPTIEPAVPRGINILSMQAMSWRTVDALAVAIVFCVMMGLSIHRLSALPGDLSLSSRVLEQPDVSQPARLTPRISASDRHALVRQDSRQSRVDGEGNIVAEDIVVHYQNRAVSLDGPAAHKPISRTLQGQLLSPRNTTSIPRVLSLLEGGAGTLTADTVVQYGSDVTMWLKAPIPRVRSSLGGTARTLTADTVVQYGPDVTMWLRASPKRRASSP